ncbi:MAG: restriction endonuclease subunit S [Ruminococcus sp.]|nr:restriction endonuclease subunit S [Ruminococcus sp.]
MKIQTIHDINEYVGTTINPLNSPDTIYELYSVPSFDLDYPEVLHGNEIGSSKVTVEENDILVCKINPRINRVWIVKHHTKHQLIASSEWVIIRSPKNDARYLCYYFQSPAFRTLINSGLTGIGGSLTRAQPKQIAKYPVPLPGIETQQCIADTLDKLQSIITHRKQQLEKLDELVKARFVEMFGDPVTNPMGWDIVNISEVISGKVSNGFFAKRDEYCDDGNVGILGVVNVVNRMYSNIVALPRTNATDKDIEKYEVKYGDMLFCRSSLVAEGIGKASIVPEDASKKILFECHVIRLPLDLNKCVPEFMQVQSTTGFFRNQVISQSKTATMTTIGQDGILKTNIILPPIERQYSFYDFIKQTNKSKFIANHMNKEYKTNGVLK